MLHASNSAATPLRWLGAALLAATLAACQPQAAPKAAVAAAKPAPTPAELAELGRALFFDPSLSASGKQSCASCHDPAHGYGPPNALAVQLGGEGLDRQGRRAPPSLAYTLNRTPVWHRLVPREFVERLTETENVPTGGFMWDGRFNTLREQARGPLLDPDEMANASEADVAAKLARAAYADRIKALFGADVFADPHRAVDAAAIALERFQLDDTSFHRYDSKFDAYLDKKAELTPAEFRGLRLFADPGKGNCAACHRMEVGANGAHPLFTDYQFVALGVPRNPELRANADPKYYDLGLCGPVREDQRDKPHFCGMFKTPTLRNTGLRGAYFHNGRFHRLEDVVRFYVERDTAPQKWYGRDKKGRTMAYDDLPPEMHLNVDHFDAPMDRKLGDKPALTGAEIGDLVAFLHTLDDGYKP
jgi:cytochrome c peroxidase